MDTNMPEFQIGDEVWRASWDSQPDYVVCPDCGGTAQITCLLYDGTQVSIECEGCKRGYEPATGRILVYTRQPRAKIAIIMGVEKRGETFEYHTTDSYVVPEKELFRDEIACKVWAREMAAERDKEEREKVNRKEKPAKSWSWHVHYHRREIRSAQKRIDYHTAQLSVAKIKAKQPEGHGDE